MYSACAGPPGDFNGHVRGFGHGAPSVGEGLHLFVDLSFPFDSHHRPRVVSTRRGIMTSEEAVRKGEDGEILADVS